MLLVKNLFNRWMCLGVMIWAPLLWAQPTSQDFMSARHVGLGGAFRALSYGTEAAYGNPAVMTLRPQYHYELGGYLNNPSSYQFGNLTVLDSTTPVAGAVSTQFASLGKEDARKTVSFTTLALALPFSKDFSVGVSGRYFLLNGGKEGNSITLDTGLAWRLWDFLVLAVSGHNLVDVQQSFLPRYYAASLALTVGTLTAIADVTRDSSLNFFNPTSASAGVEWKLTPTFPLRAGYFRNFNFDSQSLSVGAGFEADGIGIDVGYRHEMKSEGSRILAATLRYKLQ